jgi:translation initiation factor 1
LAKNSRLVYSTESGRIELGQKTQSANTGDGNVRVRREKKGRGGKTVTTVAGLALGSVELKALASELKRKCGSGGAVINGVIEIQGDQVDRVMDELIGKGYRVKRAGG